LLSSINARESSLCAIKFADNTDLVLSLCFWIFIGIAFIAADKSGSSAVLGPSGGRPWHPGGSEDPWLSVPVFRRVWFFRRYHLSVVQDWLDRLTVNLIGQYPRPNNVRFGSSAAPRYPISPMAANGGMLLKKSKTLEGENSAKLLSEQKRHPEIAHGFASSSRSRHRIFLGTLRITNGLASLTS